MSILDWLFHRRHKEQPVPLFSSEEIEARQKQHDEWEQDYRKRQRRLYELEQRANYLTARLFAPAEGKGKGRERGSGSD